MIVIEKEFLAKWIAELKRQQNSGNQDYYVGYISAMSTVEGMLALVPEYKYGDGEIFTPEQVEYEMVKHGQGNKRFKLMEKIMYSPSEVRKILRGELPRDE